MGKLGHFWMGFFILMNDEGILMDAGTHEGFSLPDIPEEASIEPHLLAWACNDVRKGGRYVTVLLICGGTSSLSGLSRIELMEGMYWGV